MIQTGFLSGFFRDTRRHNMRRTIGIISLLLVICISLSSCSGATKPEYVFLTSTILGDNKAYFSLSENNIKKITKLEFSDCTDGANADYEQTELGTYLYSVYISSENPADWEYEESESDKEKYDLDLLVKRLKEISIPFTGRVTVFIQTFGDYTFINVEKNDPVKDISGSVFTAFCKDEKIAVPENLDIGDVKVVYRFRGSTN